MWQALLTVTVSLTSLLLGIWTGGNPETVCNATSGMISYDSCMDAFGQITNITNLMH